MTVYAHSWEGVIRIRDPDGLVHSAYTWGTHCDRQWFSGWQICSWPEVVEAVTCLKCLAK